jgi:hypothetical protein
MFRPQRYLLVAALLSQLFIGCKKDDEQQPASQSGYFIVAASQNSSSPGARTAGGKTDTRFNLGPLRASREFMFMLSNGGNKDIFDITLSGDNHAFEVFPQNIQRLAGKETGGVTQVVTVGVIHGVQLHSLPGQWLAPNLPKGLNEATIAVKGKTLHGRDTIEVTGDFIVSVDAQVADAKIVCGSQDVNPQNDQGGNQFWYVYPDRTVRMVNTGNVRINAVVSHWKTVLQGMTNIYTNNNIELLPNESRDITSLISPAAQRIIEGEKTFEYSGLTTISITPNGTVINNGSFRLLTQ